MLTYSAILLAGELIMVNNIPYRTRGAFAKGKVVLKNQNGDAICKAQEISQSKGVIVSAEFDSSKISEIDEIILEYFNGKHTLTIDKIKL